MYNSYTPLQYIEPASITTISNTPATIMQTPSYIPPVQYSSPPNYGNCSINPPTIKSSVAQPQQMQPQQMQTQQMQPQQMQTQQMQTQQMQPQQMQTPKRFQAEVSIVNALTDGWSDTNIVRVDNNIRVVAFEFIETTTNLRSRSVAVSKSDEVAISYTSAKMAKNIIEKELAKFTSMPNVEYKLVPRNSDDAFVRIIISYYRDLDQNTVSAFAGYLTIYSDSDKELDAITKSLNLGQQRTSTTMSTPVTTQTVITTPVTTQTVITTPVAVQTPLVTQTMMTTPTTQVPLRYSTNPNLPSTSVRSYFSDYQ